MRAEVEVALQKMAAAKDAELSECSAEHALEAI